MLVLGAADVPRHQQETLLKSSPERPVDPEHLRRAPLLADLLGEQLKPVPESHVTKDVYRRDVSTFVGDRCERSLNAASPLANKAQLFDVLGCV